MATKLSIKAQEAFKQYSKRMCTWVSIFWMIYRLVVSVLIYCKPETANAMVHMTDGADTVMIANISVYTGNSIAEKGFYAFGKRKPYNINDAKKESEEDNEDAESDEDYNDD